MLQERSTGTHNLIRLPRIPPSVSGLLRLAGGFDRNISRKGYRCSEDAMDGAVDAE